MMAVGEDVELEGAVTGEVFRQGGGKSLRPAYESVFGDDNGNLPYHCFFWFSFMEEYFR